MQNVKRALGCPGPFRRRPIIRWSRPHELHLWSEIKSQGQRTQRLNFKKCQRTPTIRGIVRGEENFAHGEDCVRKSDHRVIRPDFDKGALLVHVDRYRVILHVGMDAQIAEDLPRKNPRLERTVLCAQDRTSRTDNRKRIRRSYIPDNLQRDSLLKRKLVDDGWLIGGLALCSPRKVEQA